MNEHAIDRLNLIKRIENFIKILDEDDLIILNENLENKFNRKTGVN
mgnify:FL=1